MSQKDTAMAAGKSGSDQNLSNLPPYYQYGTFQGVAYQSSGRPPLPPHHVVAIRQQSLQQAPDPSAPPYKYTRGYQSVPGYASLAEGTPLRDPRLPCCGLGIGWFLFLAGFFVAIPWYVGAMILICARVDYREKPGLVACMIASILTVIVVVFGVTKGAEAW